IHGVTVRWQSRPVEPYELFHAVMVGPAPDVLLVDHDMGLRLIGMDALLPLADPVDGEPAQYVLPLAEDTLWAQALRAAIPRRTAHPDLARALVAHLATAASSRPAGGVQEGLPAVPGRGHRYTLVLRFPGPARRPAPVGDHTTPRVRGSRAKIGTARKGRAGRAQGRGRCPSRRAWGPTAAGPGAA